MINLTEICPDGSIACNETITMYPKGVQLSPLMQFQTVVLGLAAAVSLVGNSLITMHITLRKSLRNTPNLYIANRSVINALNSLLAPVALTTVITGTFRYGPVVCKLFMAISSVALLVDSAIFTCMCIDCYQECRKRTSKYRSKMLRIVTTVVWVSGAVLAVPLYIFTEYYDSEIFGDICLETLMYLVYPYAFLISIVTAFLVPIVLIWVYLRLMNNPKNIQTPLEEKTKGRRRLVRTLAIAFTVCQLLYWIILFDHRTGFTGIPYREFLYVIITLIDVNHALNAILCISYHQELRNSIFFCWKYSVGPYPFEEMVQI